MVLEKLMMQIAKIEEEYSADHTTHIVCTSFGPHELPNQIAREPSDFQKERDRCSAIPSAQRFLPCHYFDFIGGSSTGA